MAERNPNAIALSFALVPIAGSLAGFVYVLLVCWAAISLVVGRLKWRSFGAAAPILWSHVAFFAVLFLVDLIKADPVVALREAGLRLFFLMPLIAVHRVAISDPRRVFDAVFKGAVIGGLLVPVVAFGQMIVTGEPRAAGLAGNAGPFSIVCLLTAGLAALALEGRRTPIFNALALLATAGASLGVVLSGMRGAWPALFIVLALVLWFRRGEIASSWRGSSLRRRLMVALSGLAVLAAVVVTGYGVALDRIAQFVTDFRQLATDADIASSLSLRAEMYQAGVEAYLDAPLIGVGKPGLWDALKPHLGAAFDGSYGFSHLHNIFLTVGVQAGLLGLLALVAMLSAPILCAYRTRMRPAGRVRLAAALVLVIAYLVPGLTNIMFFHDILDAVWALSIWTIAGTIMSEDRDIGVDPQEARA
ncbi:O-antigen ligase domain-containing protein [Fulvimarina endophytica]|uniref:O-antigen ligase domain-containing protein n=1 Tax=Fulvimarina endophytica TaxID=2293836 RepID=A0A371X8P5_9HYPH|nr:O-antigen ligase family protein [Fulvimarina endophytica]RFC65434.1 O-antigen ligase domain-containing protein [Fulvimarina endophytica]